MSKAQRRKAQETPAKGKRKLSRAEKKQIETIIRQAKGDGKAHTAQQTIPYLQMFPDGICKVTDKKYSKSIAFEDINYQLAGSDDKTAIFENWCDFLNYFDASVSVQLSFINQGTQREEAEKAVEIPMQKDAFNSIRSEYAGMLKNQLSKGNNGLVKHKYITFSVEADNPAAAKSRLARIETDILNNFKVLGVTARPLNGQEISFLNDRFRDGKTYLPFTYFAGSTADNNYTPTRPYTIRVESNHTSHVEQGYMKLFIPCGGADMVSSLPSWSSSSPWQKERYSFKRLAISREKYTYRSPAAVLGSLTMMSSPVTFTTLRQMWMDFSEKSTSFHLRPQHSPRRIPVAMMSLK